VRSESPLSSKMTQSRLAPRRDARAARRPAWRGALPLALASVLACPAFAAESAYDTSRMLQYDGNECLGVPKCVSVKSPWIPIADNSSKVFTIGCPTASPYAWHWDTEQHEHVVVRLTGRASSGITLRASNQQTGAAGAIRGYLGCSTKPFDPSGTGSMVSRSGVPSKNWKAEGRGK
jgi:hypothetical protein